jgi:hypothetical protein
MNETETFWTLVCSAAHWELELLIVFIVDVLIGLILWPIIRSKALHHQSDDDKIERLERQVKEMREVLGMK